MGQRHKDIQNGLSTPPKFSPKHLISSFDKDLVVFKDVANKNRYFGNIVGHVDGITDVRSLSFLDSRTI